MSKQITVNDRIMIITIPNVFEACDQKEIQDMYNGRAPDYSYSYKEKNAIISIFKTGNDYDDANVNQHLNEFNIALKRGVPNYGNQTLVKKIMESGGVIGAIRYTSTSITHDLFNILAIVPVNGKEVVVTAHCDLQDSLSVGTLLMDSVDSIRVLQKET